MDRKRALLLITEMYSRLEIKTQNALETRNTPSVSHHAAPHHSTPSHPILPLPFQTPAADFEPCALLSDHVVKFESLALGISVLRPDNLETVSSIFILLLVALSAICYN